MKRVIRQIRRGCGYLPHVGDHPGTGCLFAFLVLGGLTGVKGGLNGIIGGTLFMAAFMLPIYLYGAYDRAQYSDAQSLKNDKE